MTFIGCFSDLEQEISDIPHTAPASIPAPLGRFHGSPGRDCQPQKHGAVYRSKNMYFLSLRWYKL